MIFYLTPVRMAVVKKAEERAKLWRNRSPCALLVRM
jgi:hypothetical protein